MTFAPSITIEESCIEQVVHFQVSTTELAMMGLACEFGAGEIYSTVVEGAWTPASGICVEPLGFVSKDWLRLSAVVGSRIIDHRTGAWRQGEEMISLRLPLREYD